MEELLLRQASMERLAEEISRRSSAKAEELAQEHARLESVRSELEERERVVREHEHRMLEIVGSPEDVLDINAGGHIHSVARGTLCLARGSLLASLFSGRWDEGMTRDSAGRPFLDVDPYCFEQILCFLRLKRIEGPDDPAPPPRVDANKQDAFRMLLRYYGLSEFVLASSKLSANFSPPTESRSVHAYLLDGENLIRGYLVKFCVPFRLAAVYVGLVGDAEGCEIVVGRENVGLKSVALSAEANPTEPEVTHVAQGFDMLLEPPECFIMVKGNGRASAKYISGQNHDRLVGPFLINSKYRLPLQNNGFHVFMVIHYHNACV